MANYKDIEKVYQRYRCTSDRALKEGIKRNESDQDAEMTHEFRVSIAKSECEKICPNEDELCDIICNLCYTSEHSKQFAWDVCGETMLKNLMERNNNEIQYPKRVESGGEFIFSGDEYIMKLISTVKEGLEEEDIQ